MSINPFMLKSSSRVSRLDLQHFDNTVSIINDFKHYMTVYGESSVLILTRSSFIGFSVAKSFFVRLCFGFFNVMAFALFNLITGVPNTCCCSFIPFCKL